jgi:hypothetical protein
MSVIEAFELTPSILYGSSPLSMMMMVMMIVMMMMMMMMVFAKMVFAKILWREGCRKRTK